MAFRGDPNERPARRYGESDSPKIAAKVREPGIVDQPVATSDSFTRFATRLRAAKM